MMKTIIVAFCLCVASLGAQIIELGHFKELEKYATDETLLILDIDDTLLVPEQMLGCDEWFQCRWNHHQKEGLSKSDALEKSLAEWEAVRHLTKMEIVEPGIEKIISNLQKKNCRMMGLTTQGLALATRTSQQLNEKHINLTVTAPTKHDHYFLLKEHGVLFRNGILFTSGRHKGAALFQLLDQMDYHPKRIVFINDKASHLTEIKEVAQTKSVEFIGLRYAYSDARKKKFSPAVAEYQFSHSSLSRLLSDAQAIAQRTTWLGPGSRRALSPPAPGPACPSPEIPVSCT